MSTKPKIKVAAAIIWNDAQQILLSLRDKNAHQGNKWEFPGGKIEANESPQQALQRELLEELAIEINNPKEFLSFSYDYPELTVEFEIFAVHEFQGEPQGLEGQAIEWYSVNKLKQLNFPKANYQILDRLINSVE